MASFTDSITQFLHVPSLKKEIKVLEKRLHQLNQLLGIAEPVKRGRKPGRPAKAATVKAPKKRAKRGSVKDTILKYLHANSKGVAKEISKLTGLKMTSVNQTLIGLKKKGIVTQDKKRGSPFVLKK